MCASVVEVPVGATAAFLAGGTGAPLAGRTGAFMAGVSAGFLTGATAPCSLPSAAYLVSIALYLAASFPSAFSFLSASFTMTACTLPSTLSSFLYFLAASLSLTI